VAISLRERFTTLFAVGFWRISLCNRVETREEVDDEEGSNCERVVQTTKLSTETTTRSY
jgi:hypothetical protein